MGRRIVVRGRSALRQGQRRQTLWIGLDFVATSAATSASVLVASLNAAALALRPFTIVRTYMHLGLQSDQVVTTEDQVVAIGQVVVSSRAVASGIGAIPTPIGNLDSDLWFLHQWMTSSFTLLSSVGSDGQFQTNMDIESKAMRKVDVGEDIVRVIEVASASSGLTISTMGRMLVKLH